MAQSFLTRLAPPVVVAVFNFIGQSWMDARTNARLEKQRQLLDAESKQRTQRIAEIQGTTVKTAAIALADDEQAHIIQHENRVTYHLNESIASLITRDLDSAQEHLVEAHETTTCPSCKKKMEAALAKMLTAATYRAAGEEEWRELMPEIKSEVEKIRDFMPDAAKIQLERRKQSGKTPIAGAIPEPETA